MKSEKSRSYYYRIMITISKLHTSRRYNMLILLCCTTKPKLNCTLIAAAALKVKQIVLPISVVCSVVQNTMASRVEWFTFSSHAYAGAAIPVFIFFSSHDYITKHHKQSRKLSPGPYINTTYFIRVNFDALHICTVRLEMDDFFYFLSFSLSIYSKFISFPLCAHLR